VERGKAKPGRERNKDVAEGSAVHASGKKRVKKKISGRERFQEKTDGRVRAGPSRPDKALQGG